jgi:uncharacterized protein YecE (DUF72 family)
LGDGGRHGIQKEVWLIVAELLRVGTSGWHYGHWQGSFYPENMPTEEWLAYYAEHLSTVEINNSFYQLPDVGTLRNWRAGTPQGFLFAVKASRYITHMKKLKDPDEPVANFDGRLFNLDAPGQRSVLLL